MHTRIGRIGSHIVSLLRPAASAQQGLIPAAKRPPTDLKISIDQLRDIRNCQIGLGPFKLSEWDELCHEALKKKENMDKFFIRASKKRVLHNGGRFLATLTRRTAKCSRPSWANVEPYVQVFIRLRYTAAKLRRNPEMSLPEIIEMINECNAANAQLLKGLDQSVNIYLQTVSINVSQLLNLDFCDKRLGPLELKAWAEHYQCLFEGYFRALEIVNECRALDRFVLQAVVNGFDLPEGAFSLIIEIGREFLVDFIGLMEGKLLFDQTDYDQDEINRYTRAFAMLIYTAAKIRERQKNHHLFIDLVIECNRAVAKHLEPRNLSLEIIR
jgi:hypothetical protein